MLSTHLAFAPRDRYAAPREGGALLCRWHDTFDQALATLRDLAYFRLHNPDIADTQLAYGVELWEDRPRVLVLLWCDRALVERVRPVLGDNEQVHDWQASLDITGDWMSGHGAPHLIARPAQVRAVGRAA